MSTSSSTRGKIPPFWDHPPTRKNRELIERIRQTPRKPLSRDEVFEREVSFVYGNLPSSSPLSKDEVRQILLEDQKSP